MFVAHLPRLTGKEASTNQGNQGKTLKGAGRLKG